jgi:hypothetical protein
MNDKWEYKSVYIEPKNTFGNTTLSDVDVKLNQLGQEGWEAFSHQSNTANGFRYHYLIFKRKIS